MDETRTCIGCGKAYTRPTGVAPSVFARRKFCSRDCYMESPRPQRRISSYDAKTCGVCGTTFVRPPNQRGKVWASRVYCSQACVVRARSIKAWEALPVRACAICEAEFRSRYPQATTCGSEDCKRRYRREIAAQKTAEFMKQEYASGRRKAARGTSPRELALRPLLEPHGWASQLRWFDSWGCFEMDFVDMRRLINVEIDGDAHRWRKQRERDEARDAELVRRGWTVVRIQNAEVDVDLEEVAGRILAL